GGLAFLTFAVTGTIGAIFGAPILIPTLVAGAIGAAVLGFIGRRIGRSEEARRTEQFSAIIPTLPPGPPPPGFAPALDRKPKTADQELQMIVEHAQQVGTLDAAARQELDVAGANVRNAINTANYKVNDPQAYYRKDQGKTRGEPAGGPAPG